jgi:hypothetical protein
MSAQQGAVYQVRLKVLVGGNDYSLKDGEDVHAR